MNQRYAGFWIRFVATLIDFILLLIISSVIGFLVGLMFGKTALAISNLLGWAISIGYYVVYQEKYGQTIGKKAMNIKVVTYDGKTPTKFTFFLREIIGKLISGIILLIGYLMVLWDAKKQALHDKIASTYVVYVEQAGAQQQAATVQQQAAPAQQQPVNEPQQAAQGKKI